MTGRHETRPEVHKVTDVLVLLGKDVRGIVSPCDMRQGDLLVDDRLSDSIFPDVEMPHPFGRKGRGPINATLVVIVERDGTGWLG